MKKLVLIAAMALAGASMAMTLQAAKGQIPGAVANPAKMAEIMKELSEEDQIEFLALVNQAISEMSGSANELAAIYLAVNEAALRAHGNGNLQALLATTYATVPPEALTVLNERLAADLFNRNADPTKPVSDAAFANLAKEAMKTISEKASTTDEASVRTTFALLMFLRASGGTPSDLRDTLAESITDPAAKELALNEWIPAAMGEQGQKSYDGMLGAVDASNDVPDVAMGQPGAPQQGEQGEQGQQEIPHTDDVLVIASPEGMIPLLSDLATDAIDYTEATIFSMGQIGFPQYSGTSVGTQQVSPVDDSPYSPDRERGDTPGEGGGEGGGGVNPEPIPYPFQN